MVKPVTVIGVPEPEAVTPPGFDVTVYEVIVSPPVVTGGNHETVACPFPLVAAPINGALGTEMTWTIFEGADGGLIPTALEAVAVKVYGVPPVSPLTVAILIFWPYTLTNPPPVAVMPPGFDVTV